jgi:hypothetical protein
VAQLLPQQRELLAILVEASRSVGRNERQAFLFIAYMNGTQISHPGLSAIGKADYRPYLHDARELARYGLVTIEEPNKGVLTADVTAEGYEYYDQMKRGDPVARIEKEIRAYMDADAFAQRHPASIAKWRQAESAVWSSDSARDLTTIGHLCREAMQAFATESLGIVDADGTEQDVQKTVSRMRTAIGARVASERVRGLSEALLSYWGAVVDLVQRQEHGAAKEGDELMWEDGRRVVFQTFVAMYEIDRTIR